MTTDRPVTTGELPFDLADPTLAAGIRAGLERVEDVLHSVLDNDIEFASDLYRGTAAYYDRYRLPYPDAMIADLMGRAAPSGRGRLLDLACGTGQLAFPLAPWFAEVWAVDSEPDMIDVVRAKAAGAGPYGARIQAAALKAEELRVDPGSFELIVIGNAFHRLKRERVAQRAYDWLPPGRCLALC